MIRSLSSVFSLLCLPFLLLLTNCKKDLPKMIEEGGISTSDNWQPTQNVRINRVEFRVPEEIVQHYSDSLITVNYLYAADGMLKSIESNINFETSGISEIFKVSETGENIFIENFSETCRRYALFGLMLADNDIRISSNRVDGISGKVNNCTFGFIASNRQKMYSDFSYDKKGLLSSINSYFDFFMEGIPPLLIREINSVVYDLANAVKSLKVVFYSFDEEPLKLEDYSIQFEYHSTTDIPDGLVRIVNQSILEMNSLGYDWMIYQPFYLMDYSNYLKRGFSDWVCAFGLPKVQTIPAKNVDLISKKHITGSRLVYNDNTDVPVSVNVDAIADFPYIHDATAKTLEIAGLKIWYELVE